MTYTTYDKLNDTEAKYLRYFALFPDISLQIIDIFDYFNIKNRDQTKCFDVLFDLSKKDYLLQKKDSFKLTYKKQIEVFENLKPNAINCKPLITTFINKLYLKPEEKISSIEKYIPLAESIVDTINDQHENLKLLTNNIFVSYRMLGNYKKSIEYNLKNIDIEKKLLGNNHKDLASSYFNIAITYAKIGELKKSLTYNIKALEIRERVLDPFNINLCRSYNNTSIAYSKLKKYREALKYALQTIKINETSLDKDFHLLGSSYYNTALICFNINDYEESIYYINKAIELHTKVLPAEHPDLLDDLSIQKKIKLHYKLSINIPKILKIVISIIIIGIIASLIYLFLN